MECERHRQHQQQRRRRIMNEIKENVIKRKFNIYKELYYGANSVFRTRLPLLLFPYSRFRFKFFHSTEFLYKREGEMRWERTNNMRWIFFFRCSSSHTSACGILSTDIFHVCVLYTQSYIQFFSVTAKLKYEALLMSIALIALSVLLIIILKNLDACMCLCVW